MAIIYLFLFLFGLAAGSFINVVATRYKENGPLLPRSIIAGRSYCPQCKKDLVWHELMPLVSFFAQKGRCRHCEHRLSWQYPISEVLAGLIFVLVPLWFGFSADSALWIVTLLVLLLVALIDFRFSVIPDQLNLLLLLTGLAIVASNWESGSVWASHLIGAAFGLLVFALIILATKGKGMGLGDLKLAGTLGWIYGWPSALLLIMAAFLIGGIWAAGMLFFKKRSFKDAIPFGPFLAIAAVLVLFFGNDIITMYVNGR